MGKERTLTVEGVIKPRNFAVDLKKYKDLTVHLHEFLHSLLNDDGTPSVIPDYVTIQYCHELIASISTNLRAYGEKMHPERIQLPPDPLNMEIN